MNKYSKSSILCAGMILSSLLTSCDMIHQGSRRNINAEQASSSYYGSRPQGSFYEDEQRRRREEEERRRREEEQRRRFLNNANIYVANAANTLSQYVMTDINSAYGKAPTHQLAGYIHTDEYNFTYTAKVKLQWIGRSARFLAEPGLCEVEGDLIISVDKEERRRPVAQFIPSSYNRKVESILSRLKEENKPILREQYVIEL